MSVHFRWVSPLNFYSPIFTLYLVLYGDNSQFKVIKAQKSFSNGLGSGKVKVEKEKKKKILKIPTRWAFLLPWVNWEKVHKNSIIVPIHSALFSLLLAFRVHSLERTKVILAFRSFFRSCSFFIHLWFSAAPDEQTTTFRSRFRSLEWNTWGFYGHFSSSVFIVCFLRFRFPGLRPH